MVDGNYAPGLRYCWTLFETCAFLGHYYSWLGCQLPVTHSTYMYVYICNVINIEDSVFAVVCSIETCNLLGLIGILFLTVLIRLTYSTEHGEFLGFLIFWTGPFLFSRKTQPQHASQTPPCFFRHKPTCFKTTFWPWPKVRILVSWHFNDHTLSHLLQHCWVATFKAESYIPPPCYCWMSSPSPFHTPWFVPASCWSQDSTFRDFAQGAYRLRGIKKGQRLQVWQRFLGWRMMQENLFMSIPMIGSFLSACIL